ncbi:unnamed protein product [Pieris macdunnoughi]|uniref:Uncharacterized protein n=1 Tax=Pieris macdunnoughi TaxID=345717 RepID=A0A821SY14_9NEOP|nr:unnamed protein product [Pieris macdunnoughi]
MAREPIEWPTCASADCIYRSEAKWSRKFHISVALCAATNAQVLRDDEVRRLAPSRPEEVSDWLKAIKLALNLSAIDILDQLCRG